MGFLDNVFKAVEGGGIEKTLNGALDKLEHGLDRVTNSAEKLATAPAEALDRAEKLSDQAAKAAGSDTKSEQ
jgi:hypothetical protein